MGAWRLAESLKELRRQTDARWPGRDKTSDGAIGDAAHASRDSDHNPWVRDQHGIGVVTAIDIDADLSGSEKVDVLLASLIASRDPRIKYIIRNRRIMASYPVRGIPAWTWRPYSGKNAHDHHAHISVHSDRSLYDDARPWAVPEPVGSKQSAVSSSETGEPVSSPVAGVTSGPASSSPATQTAENITNVQTGGSNVPPDFVPEDKEVPAPAKENSTATSTKMTIAGFVVPAFLVGIIRALQDAIHDGYIDAKDVGTAVIQFITSNTKYVFIGVFLIVAGMMLKKLYKQVTLWISMYIAARADMHNVTVKPQ